MDKYFSCGELIESFCSDEEALRIVQSLRESDSDSFAYEIMEIGLRKWREQNSGH